MPRYRFQVLTPKGRERKGKITATDIDNAREMLQNAGFQVLTLSPTVEIIQQGSTSVVATPRERPGFKPTFTDKVIDLDPEPQRLKIFLSALVILGLVLLVFDYARRQSLPPKPLTSTENLRQVSVRLEGELTKPDDGWDGVKVTFDFPQVPLHVERLATELVDEEGHFTFDYSFHSRRQPASVGLLVQKRGFAPVRLQPATLTGEPLSAEFEPVRLRR